jgi:hypothetical protein
MREPANAAAVTVIGVWLSGRDDTSGSADAEVLDVATKEPVRG